MTAVCNFCAQTSPIDHLLKVHSTPLLKDKVLKHLPFIDMKITSPLHICPKCKDTLDRWSLFFNKCIQVQKTIYSMEKLKCAPGSKKNSTRKYYCCAKFCQNTSLDEKLFCLPKKNIERAKQWLLNADRADLLEGVEFNVAFIKRKTLALCRQHFELKMFFNDLRETLVATAVPTLFKGGLRPKREEKKEEEEAVLSNYRKIYPRPATDLTNLHSTNHNKENKATNLLVHSDGARGELYSVVFLTQDSGQSDESAVLNNEVRYEISTNCTLTQEAELGTMGESKLFTPECDADLKMHTTDRGSNRNVDTNLQVAPMDANIVSSQVVPTDNGDTCAGLGSQILPADHPDTKQTRGIEVNDSTPFDFIDMTSYEVNINGQPLHNPATNTPSTVCESGHSEVIFGAADSTLSGTSGFATNENTSNADKAMDTSEPCPYSNLCQDIIPNTDSNLSVSFSSIKPEITYEKLNEECYMQSVTDVDPLSTLMVTDSLLLEESDRLLETHAEDLIEMPSNLVETRPNMMETYSYLIETPSDIVENPANLMELSGNAIETPTNITPTNLAETPSNLIDETPLNFIPTPSDSTLSDTKWPLLDEHGGNYSVLDYDTSRLLNAQLSSGMMMFSCEFCGDTLLTEGLLRNHCKLYHSM